MVIKVSRLQKDPFVHKVYRQLHFKSQVRSSNVFVILDCDCLLTPVNYKEDRKASRRGYSNRPLFGLCSVRKHLFCVQIASKDD